jgi:hypothetical protein
MKRVIKPVVQWFHTPWPLFVSMALCGVTALTLSFLGMHNLELQQSPNLPPAPTTILEQSNQSQL